MDNTNALKKAVQRNDAKWVQSLIRDISLINIFLLPDFGDPPQHGMTPLMLASELNNLEIVQILLEANCDVNLQNRHGESALYFACNQGHVNIVLKLLKAGASLEPNKKKTVMALHVACLSKNFEIIKLLVEKSNLIDKSLLLDAQDDYGLSPLMISCDQNSLEIANFLIQWGCRVNLKDKSGRTALHHALLNTDEDLNLSLIKLLVEAGAKINAADNDSITPLYLACTATSKTDITSFLLEHGANSCCEVDGFPLLYLVVDNLGDKDFELGNVDLLLKYGANPNCSDPGGECPLIVLAAMMGYCEAVQLLITHNCDANMVDMDGSIALHKACDSGDLAMVNILLAGNSNVNHQDLDGLTPLHLACKEGHTEIAKILIDHGCDVDIQTRDGDTPLFWACIFKEYQIAKLLVIAGCCFTIFDKESIFKIAMKDYERLVPSDLVYYRPITIDLRLPNLLLEAGFTPRQDPSMQPIEDYIGKFDKQIIIDNQELFENLKKLCEEPRTLKFFCCHTVRKIFGRRLNEKVHKLEIPTYFKQILTYNSSVLI